MKKAGTLLGIALVLPLVLFSQQANEPKLIHEVKPAYPREACPKNIKGNVLVEAIVDEAGKVTKVKARSGRKMFRKSALQAVSKWKWEPWVVNGKPTPFVTHVEVAYEGFFTEGCGSMMSVKIVDWSPR